MSTQAEIVVSKEQIEFLKREGYLQLEGFIPMQDVEKLRAYYDRFFSGGYQLDEKDMFDLASQSKGTSGKKLLPQIMNPHRYEAGLHATLYYKRAFELSRQIMGEATRFSFDHMIDKPPHVAHETPWHQDMGYWGLDDKPAEQERLTFSMLNFWLSLDRADVDNGCMQFVPQSHTGALIRHRHINDDPKVHGKWCEVPAQDKARAVACPLQPGGVTIHWPKTLHYTGPNKSDRQRRAYIMEFEIPR